MYLAIYKDGDVGLLYPEETSRFVHWCWHSRQQLPHYHHHHWHGTTATNSSGAWNASVRTGGRQHHLLHVTHPTDHYSPPKATNGSAVVERWLKALGLV